MENKNPKPGNNENPMDEPEDGTSRFDSDFSMDKAGQQTPPQSPDGEAGSASESRKAVTDFSSPDQEQLPEPSTPQADIKGLDDDDSMDSLGKEAPTPASPREMEESTNQPSDLRAEPDIIEDLRRTLEKIEPEEKHPGLFARFSDWLKGSFSPPRRKRADDASIDARLGDEILSYSSKTDSVAEVNEHKDVHQLFGELEHLADTESGVPKPADQVEAPAQFEKIAEPAPEVAISEPQLGSTEAPFEPSTESTVVEPSAVPPVQTPEWASAPTGTESAFTPGQPREQSSEMAGGRTLTQPVESSQDTERTDYELIEGSQGLETPYANYQDLRETALENFEEEPVASKIETSENPIKLITRSFRQLTTSQKRLLAVAVIVVLGIAVVVGLYLFSASRPPKPAPTPTIVLGPSYPAGLTLTAGWDFPLAVGKIQDNKWSPQGAEWLEGTEISRWVSLPWSPQLEAVVGTLKPGDPLILIMTNGDHLRYIIQSVKQRRIDSQAGVDQMVQTLEVFISNPNTKKTLVITAVPQ